jgi:hypothetical protein
MADNDIKSLLDDIIDNTDKSYPATNMDNHGNTSLTYDRGGFREKLSLGVLKDIVSGMMCDHVEDMDGMIDDSIIKHIAKNYNGSCYGYLCKARDNLNSPLIGDIIQEIDNAVEKADEHIKLTKDPSSVENMFNPIELAKSVDNYEEFRDKMGKYVSKKVIDNVTEELVDNNDAPKFKDTIDNELKAKTPEHPETEPTSDSTKDNQDVSITYDNMISPKNESFIITAASKIITESYRNAPSPVSIDYAMNLAICEYCISMLDICFKNRSKENFFSKYLK